MLHNGMQPWHLLVLALVVILLFGSKKLPDTARALGKSMRILKSEAKAMKDDGAPATASPAPAPGEPVTPLTIQAAPGDTTSARPVREGGPTTTH
ncbi:Sec-independent protein translocase subunit TatA [Streptomyces sp. H10-C2]|uniref:Sec-independent protein translocase subunit TatA n=1 Tax=unclassified Streptomyces TaxID=2593676 RepID=UPI0024B98671|nr:MULTISPECIES: Sec-independent protein translocase subunit TatA [unclassified Streptomyces]MDJ0346122.1 Sec-independent protein translocase subunit TatA [Streptomyces sp. PH10-H1]MDJ0371616.1 Sec-independent protein translocase subunit TatA [Streptomyces sp. H10-C2]